MSQDTPAKAMAFDLAIGRTKSEVLRMTDWRTPVTENQLALQYYKTGVLSHDKTKVFMNRPDEILPTGEFGVVNEYFNKTKVVVARYPETENKEVKNLQWDMPEPASRKDVPLAKEEVF